jgi:hypothetical protein
MSLPTSRQARGPFRHADPNLAVVLGILRPLDHPTDTKGIQSAVGCWLAETDAVRKSRKVDTGDACILEYQNNQYLPQAECFIGKTDSYGFNKLFIRHGYINNITI